jgi:glyceraldehyde 3-phosphate dehydrogenase
MTIRVAINGFGRIGRLVLRAALEARRNDMEFAAINDLGSVEDNARLLRYDSVHGRFGGEVKTGADWINAGQGQIKVLAEKDPAKLPWKQLGIDIVMECTGRFTKKAQAEAHIAGGAQRVLVSAPCDGADLTVVYGLNHDKLTAAHKVVSNASCTTNCLAPVAWTMHQAVGIKHGFMTTIHAYTGDQKLVDTLHNDPRRARAAALSLIPASTGAAKAMGLVLPELAGKLDGTAIRVPTPNVSLVDFKFEAARTTNSKELNEAAKAAAAGKLKGVLAINEEPLVSSDFNHDPASSVFDLTQTIVVDGTLCRVMAWYDNEWGFSNRMSDTAAVMGRLG